MRSFLTRATALGVFAMAVAGCAASNGTALPPTSTANNGGGAQGSINGISTGTAAVRFVHGSPDAGPVDICVDGTFLATNVTYGTVSSYYIVTGAVPHVVSVYAYVKGDTTNAPCGSNSVTPNTTPVTGSNGVLLETSVTPASNVRTSIVVAGSVANGTLTKSNIVVAAAPALNISTPIQPTVFVVAASPANSSIAFGYFNPSVTGSGTAANTPVDFTTTTAGVTAATKFAFGGTGTVAATSLPAFASATGVGIGFFAATYTAPLVPLNCLYAGAVPTTSNPACTASTAADKTNKNDVLPYTTSNDYLLEAFVVDGPTGSKAEVIGAYDPTTLGY